MSIKNEKTDIKVLSALIAPGCNLQCSYCQMAKNTKESDKKELWENNIEALKNGDFIKNIKKTLIRLNQSPFQIEGIEFWGQEPTLTLPYVTEHWEDWIKAFPNISYSFFSTNGMTDSDVIYDYLLSVDKYSIHPFEVGIQISYDGKYGEDIVRGGSSEFMLDNFLKLVKKINEFSFNKIKKIMFNLHGVVSLDLVHELNTLDKVNNYFKEYDSFLRELSLASANEVIEWRAPVFLAENCRPATTEEGMAISNFCTMAGRIRDMMLYPNTLYHNGDQDFAIHMAGVGAHNIYETAKEGNYEDYEAYIDDYLAGNPEHPLMRSLSGISCSAYFGDLKIMYDGTTVLCQNLMFDAYSDFQVLKDDVSNWARYYLIQKGKALNKFDATEKETNEFFEFLYEIQDGSRLIFSFMSNYNLMFLMSKLGQINPEYAKDPSLLKKLAFTFTRIQSCPFNAEVLTGSTLLRQSGEIREFANGLGEEIIREIDKAVKENFIKTSKQRRTNDKDISR